MGVTQSDRAGPDASNSDFGVDDETVDNESMYCDSEQIESDSDQIHVLFSTAQSNHSNAAGKRSITGPSANCDEW